MRKVHRVPREISGLSRIIVTTSTILIDQSPLRVGRQEHGLLSLCLHQAISAQNDKQNGERERNQKPFHEAHQGLNYWVFPDLATNRYSNNSNVLSIGIGWGFLEEFSLCRRQIHAETL